MGDPGDGGMSILDSSSAFDGYDGAQAADGSDASTDDGSTAPTCGDGGVALGQYATWQGKVNVHRTLGLQWAVDTDCSSGANNNTVAYCKKYWPTTTVQVPFTTVSSEQKPFTAGGGAAPTCGGVYPFEGQLQFLCCGNP